MNRKVGDIRRSEGQRNQNVGRPEFRRFQVIRVSDHQTFRLFLVLGSQGSFLAYLDGIQPCLPSVTILSQSLISCKSSYSSPILTLPISGLVAMGSWRIFRLFCGAL